MVIIEGNYGDAVKKRTISINGKYIRGFITPKYDDAVIVNETMGTSKDIDIVAREVITGVWGDMPQRKDSLERNGINYEKVQNRVNEILNIPVKTDARVVEASCYADSFNKYLKGTYVTATGLYCRNDAGSNKKALCLIPKDTKVSCYGFYTSSNGIKWPLIEFNLNNVKYTGFSCIDYLRKISG